MENLDLNMPKKITITNITKEDQFFVPYKENFVQKLVAGGSLEFNSTLSTEALYYKNLEIDGIFVVEIIEVETTTVSE